MKLKKLAAIVLTAIMAISALGITAFATDPVGTKTITIKDGKKASASVPFDKGSNSLYASDYFNNGANYVDFKYVAASDGTLSIKFDVAIDKFYMRVYDADKQQVTADEHNSTSGLFYRSDGRGLWNESAGLYSGVVKYKVKKGTYYIRINRAIDGKYGGNGKGGNGRVHITCEMDLPKAPTNIKVSNITGSSAKFTWTEPKGCNSYDLRYRVQGTEKWTVKKNINDDNVTIKNLKASKTYEYQMRSYSGKTVGNWGKTGKFKTTGAAYSGKLGVPSAKKVTIEWGAVSNAVKYEIRYKVGNGSWTTKTVESTSYTISVSAGKTYTYQIRAVNGNNKGDWSANKTFNT